MDFPGGNECRDDHGTQGTSSPPRRPADWVTFTPMAFNGLDWVRITSPQPTARFACLAVTAYISLLRPGTPLHDLDARAEAAIRALEDGAPTVTVIDDRHRVDRVDLCPAQVARQ